MTIPHRDFTSFRHVSLHGYGASNFTDYDDWLNDHIENCILGLKQISEFPGADIKEQYYILYKGTEEEGWGVIDGADGVMSVCAQIRFHKPYFNEHPITAFTLSRGCVYENADNWDPDRGTGRYTDGDSAQYFDYPIDFHAGDITMTSDYSDIPVPTDPTVFQVWHEAWNAFGNEGLAYIHRNYILTRGMFLGINTYTPGTINWANGDGLFMSVDIEHVRIKYFNSIVNSFSRYYGPTAGGFPLVLSGLGLHNNDDEIDEGGYSRVADGGGSWTDCVDLIYIEDLDGNVMDTLQVDLAGVPGGRDFSRGSNTEITIYSFPALPAGTYQLRLAKEMSLVGAADCEAYAGDWRADDAGRMRTGKRLYISLGDPTIHPSVPLVCFSWKKGDSYSETCYAPIDVRSDLKFYEGLLLSMSSFTRGTNDSTGTPLFPDMELELDNTSREFSRLLAEYWVKNQIVEAFICFRNDPETMKSMVFRGIVEDYEKPGSIWKVRLRDVMGKYFDAKVPRYRCTEEEYPDIYKNHIGREKPECLGRGVLDTGSTRGAVEAVYIDTTEYKYLASCGWLHAVFDVYSNDSPVSTADYTLSWEADGGTYITFDSDQGDNKITFDYEGYMYADWDDASSSGGFVWNPAYIMLYYLAFIAEIPLDYIDVDSFDDLADYYAEAGWDQSGYFILNDEQGADAAFSTLLYTYGAKCWEAGDGRITIGRKRATDFATNIHLFQQIDALEEAAKPMGFSAVVNHAPIHWAYFPSANIYAFSDIVERQPSIDAFETEIEPTTPWDFPWTDDESLAAARAEEDLLKLGFGDQKISLSISVEQADLLDILDTFRFQDPHGISLDGSGDVGRYWYVENLTFDVFAGSIQIQGVDLQWLLRQYCVLGDEDARAGTWATATEADRMYCYLCDETTGLFSDGEPGKKLIDENL